jgi:3-oxoacyl-[acyl-carrier-protein] synthase-1/3-oxoacyl-[acyl-carrier-protein] synthase II
VTPALVLAAGWVSAAGVAPEGLSPGSPGDGPRSFIARDPELESCGLRRPFAARAGEVRPGDRARALLLVAARALVRELDEVSPSWRTRRLVFFIGTSAGGMNSLERALALRSSGAALPRDLARAALYDGPLAALDEIFDVAAARVQILAACASSTFAIGLGARHLEENPTDLVIAGGYDALSAFVANGFEALGATTKAAPPRPFRHDRDGMALGEGAALLALTRGSGAERGRGYVLGFGATSDAVHVTAPDELGRGLSRAAEKALADAGLDARRVELVSAHATATRHNDAAEMHALNRIFDAASAPVLQPYKAVIGHALGAAGALETLAALTCLSERVLPAAVGDGELDADFRGRLLERNERATASVCLKLSAAFGGTNAALVVGLEPSVAAIPTPRRRVVARALGGSLAAADLALVARASGRPLEELERLDSASQLAASAVASVLERVALVDPAQTAVVVGTTAASLECNEAFDRPRRTRGPHLAPPRLFPPTSPNVPAGRCSILFGLRGPSLAVGGGRSAAAEALLVAHDLVARGDALEAVVIAADDTGPVTRDILTAAGLPLPPRAALGVVLGVAAADEPHALSRAVLLDRLIRSASLPGVGDGGLIGCEALRQGVGAPPADAHKSAPP